MKLWLYILYLFVLFPKGQCAAEEDFKTRHVVFCRYEMAGFFACFNVVVGALDAYENGEIGGLTVDFGPTGLYYDVAKGMNWWKYYFKPVSIGDSRLPRIDLKCGDVGGYSWNGAFALSRDRCDYLIKKYIHIRKGIAKKVKGFIRRKMHGKKFVAVQYRGTDKFGTESEFLSQEGARDCIAMTLTQRGMNRCKIFVATDVQSFVSLMKKRFGKRIVCIKAPRSKNGQPVHFRKDIGGYKKGRAALVDCLILSRSKLLIRTASNLSNMALCFNPKLESILLNKSLWPDR